MTECQMQNLNNDAARCEGKVMIVMMMMMLVERIVDPKLMLPADARRNARVESVGVFRV